MKAKDFAEHTIVSRIENTKNCLDDFKLPSLLLNRFGVSLALHEGTAFQNGEVRDSNLDTYSPLRMSDVPDLEIHFMQSDEFPTGLGEPPSLPVPPAIGNAVYAATGKRARSLPIRL